MHIAIKSGITISFDMEDERSRTEAIRLLQEYSTIFLLDVKNIDNNKAVMLYSLISTKRYFVAALSLQGTTTNATVLHQLIEYLQPCMLRLDLPSQALSFLSRMQDFPLALLQLKLRNNRVDVGLRHNYDPTVIELIQSLRVYTLVLEPGSDVHELITFGMIHKYSFIEDENEPVVLLENKDKGRCYQYIATQEYDELKDLRLNDLIEVIYLNNFIGEGLGTAVSTLFKELKYIEFYMEDLIPPDVSDDKVYVNYDYGVLMKRFPLLFNLGCFIYFLKATDLKGINIRRLESQSGQARVPKDVARNGMYYQKLNNIMPSNNSLFGVYKMPGARDGKEKMTDADLFDSIFTKTDPVQGSDSVPLKSESSAEQMKTLRDLDQPEGECGQAKDQVELAVPKDCSEETGIDKTVLYISVFYKVLFKLSNYNKREIKKWGPRVQTKDNVTETASSNKYGIIEPQDFSDSSLRGSPFKKPQRLITGTTLSTFQNSDSIAIGFNIESLLRPPGKKSSVPVSTKIQLCCELSASVFCGNTSALTDFYNVLYDERYRYFISFATVIAKLRPIFLYITRPAHPKLLSYFLNITCKSRRTQALKITLKGPATAEDMICLAQAINNTRIQVLYVNLYELAITDTLPFLSTLVDNEAFNRIEDVYYGWILRGQKSGYSERDMREMFSSLKSMRKRKYTAVHFCDRTNFNWFENPFPQDGVRVLDSDDAAIAAALK